MGPQCDLVPDEQAYNNFYVAQLTELCTRYGPLFEIWFDGAGSEGRSYDWDRIMAVVDEHQPDAMVFNMGRPTIRWVGNEDGLAADPVHYVAEKRQRAGNSPNLGAAYLPPECDVPIRRNWFWQTDDLHTLKSLQHLLGIYYRSVGLGAGLLLNVGPDRNGLIDDADRSRLIELGAEISRRFDHGTQAELIRLTDGTVRARFGREVQFDHLVIEEDLSRGQRVSTHAVLADGRELASGQTVGVRRIHAFDDVAAQELELRVGGDGAHLAAVTAHLTGATSLPRLEDQPAEMSGKFD